MSKRGSIDRRTALVGGLVLALSSCQAVPRADDDARLFALPGGIGRINAIRADHGAPALSPDIRLQRMAEAQALRMAQLDEVAHTLERGRSFGARVREAGYRGNAHENLGGGYGSLDGAIRGWLASPAHRENLLNPLHLKIGLAAAEGFRPVRDDKRRYRRYWAVVFGQQERPAAGFSRRQFIETTG